MPGLMNAPLEPDGRVFLRRRHVRDTRGIDETTQWRLVKAGKLKVYKVGGVVLYDAEEVDAYIRSCAVTQDGAA